MDIGKGVVGVGVLHLYQVKYPYFIAFRFQKCTHGFQQFPGGVGDYEGTVCLQQVWHDEEAAFAGAGAANDHYIVVAQGFPGVHAQIKLLGEDHVGTAGANQGHGNISFLVIVQVLVPLGRAIFNGGPEVPAAQILGLNHQRGNQPDQHAVSQVGCVKWKE